MARLGWRERDKVEERVKREMGMWCIGAERSEEVMEVVCDRGHTFTRP